MERVKLTAALDDVSPPCFFWYDAPKGDNFGVKLDYIQKFNKLSPTFV